MKPRDLFRSSAPGAAAGVLAWALDQGFAGLTLGYRVPATLRQLVFYPLFGVGLAVLLRAVAGRRLGSRFGPWENLLATTALLGCVGFVERVVHVAQGRSQGDLLVWIAAVAAAVGYGVVLTVLTRIAGAFRRAAPLAIVSLALVLAINRNLLHHSGFLFWSIHIAIGVSLLAAAIAARFRPGSWKIGIPLAAAILVVFGRWAVPPPPTPPAGPEGPKIVFLVLDTLRADVFESVVRETEEGRRFEAAFGPALRFRQAIAVAPWTAPSVASLLTGLYPIEHGFGPRSLSESSYPLRPLHPEITTFVQELRGAGLWTESIVTNPLLHPVTGLDRGFDHYRFLSGPTVKLPFLTALAELGIVTADYAPSARTVRSHLRARAEKLRRAGSYFLWLHLMDPHTPLRKHPELGPDPGVEDGTSEDERDYRNEVRFALAQSALMLEDLDPEREAIRILVSDHGEMFPSDGHTDGYKGKTRGHGHALYEELVRVPLWIHRPGEERDREMAGLVSQVDVSEAILQEAGVAVVEGEGPRLAEYLRTPPDLDSRAPEREVLMGFAQHGPALKGLRTHGFKLIEKGGRPKFFDLREDPEELEAANSRLRPQLRRSRRILRERWNALVERQQESSPTKGDETIREQLEALGYL